MIPTTDENTEEARALQAVDGRHGRTESHEIRVWWEVVIEGRVWNTRNETEAREIAQRASEIGTEHELRRVEAVSRTETVTKVEVLSPIDGVQGDGGGGGGTNLKLGAARVRIPQSSQTRRDSASQTH